MSVLNSNTNLLDKYDWDNKLQATKYTGGQLIPSKSELKKVLNRRLSRQSNRNTSTVDFEHKGSAVA